MMNEVRATIEHVRALCADGVLPPNAEIDATQPPLRMAQLLRYRYGRRQLAGVLGVELREDVEAREQIRRRMLELAEEFGQPPTIDQYMQNRNGAPTIWGAYKRMFRDLSDELFGDFRRFGRQSKTNRLMQQEIATGPIGYRRETEAPPENLPAKLKWSMGGLMATECYEDKAGRLVYRLR